MEAQARHRRGPVLQLDPQNLARMRQLLTEIQPYISRAKPGILRYFTANTQADESSIRQLLTYRHALMDQWEDPEFKTLKSQFTVDPVTVAKAMNEFKVLFSRIYLNGARPNQRPTVDGQLAQASPAAMSQIRPEVHPGGPNQIAEVKTTNQRMKAEKPPQAPINETPPNSFHHGPPPPIPIVAAAAGTSIAADSRWQNQVNEMRSDKLVLPENKLKRKANGQLAGKTQSPPQIKPTTPIVRYEPSFRCTHPGCEFEKRGLSTGEQLAQHIEDAHKEKEPEDGLQFALEMARVAFNLDPSGLPIKVIRMEKSVSAQTMMRKSTSTQGLVPKLDGGTSMSRGTTQTSNLGLPRTPQSLSRLGTKSSTRKNDAVKEPQTPDSWADCLITQAELKNLFPSNEALQGTLDLTGLTPSSTLASGKSERNTPKSDAINNVVVVGNNSDENWIPAALSEGHLRPYEIIPMMNDDILGMAWEHAFAHPPLPAPSNKRRKVDPNGGFNPNLFTLNWSD